MNYLIKCAPQKEEAPHTGFVDKGNHMQNKGAIYDALKDILQELFEIEASEISPDSNLYEDMDIDSIDAVDMIVKLKEITGKKLQPSDFKQVRTVQDVVDAVYLLFHEEKRSEDPGFSQEQSEVA